MEAKKLEQNANSIIVDDGSVRVPILNKQGEEMGVFYFRPTDIGLVDRFNRIADEIGQITEPLQNVNISSEGTVDQKNEAEFTALKEAERRLYDACDVLFGGNMSEAFFGKMHPFSPVGGRFYCENALEAVGNYISRQFARETNRINSRVDKYVHGYTARTGKHRNGKR